MHSKVRINDKFPIFYSQDTIDLTFLKILTVI